MPIITRDAALLDAPRIADIYNQAVLHTTATFDTLPQSAEEREAWLASHGVRHPVLVAEADGTIVGWAALSRYSDRCAYDRTAEVSVYVDEGYRARGVGRALTGALLARAREIGMHALLARICSENAVSLRMTEAHGFERIGVMREVGEKFGRVLDVVILELLV